VQLETRARSEALSVEAAPSDVTPHERKDQGEFSIDTSGEVSTTDQDRTLVRRCFSSPSKALLCDSTATETNRSERSDRFHRFVLHVFFHPAPHPIRLLVALLVDSHTVRHFHRLTVGTDMPRWNR